MKNAARFRLSTILRVICAMTLWLAGSYAAVDSAPSSPRSLSGIYPSLAMFNQEGECGTGAVVPWADRLWAITYAPHKPRGSTDKLYEITPALEQIVRSESIGGTPANRMIHRESQQLFVGPYAIDANRNVRVIPYVQMFGRPTGNARHLTDPANRIYYATMEEGLYEVDVKSLAVTQLWADEAMKSGRHSDLPGYHGKGLYSGQGVIVYSNNGDHAREARTNPRAPSGVLAEWDGRADAWTVVRRNQFTEVSGPGGIEGSAQPETDPIWSMGWDHRSLLLMMRDAGKWHTYRLPKASRSYDGAHGWNTEWPRIRDIQEPDLLMTMHGMFWRFPRSFCAANTAGIRPRSAYLKVVGDFCRWNDRLVFGCDDTTKSAFLNKRKIDGGIAGAGQSQSNLWFTELALPDKLGPTLAEGAVWLRETVKTGDVSDPFLFAGWRHRTMHLVNDGMSLVSFTLEIDASGKGAWRDFRTVRVEPGKAERVEFGLDVTGEWARVRVDGDCSAATAHFVYSDSDARGGQSAAIFAGLANIHATTPHLSGLVRAQGDDKRTLQVAALRVEGSKTTNVGYYELDSSLKLKPVDEPASFDWMTSNVAIPREVVTVDTASILIVDDQGKRWRLPKSDDAYDTPTRDGLLRVCREVATERSVLNLHGTFYELPAENADGFAKLRPIASHRLRVMDFCSYRGLMVLTGVNENTEPNEHIIRSANGKAAVWAGAIDDLWQLGKPVGHGGPWVDANVQASVPSDPYLFWGFDRRKLTVRASAAVNIQVEVDITGEGLWVPHCTVNTAERESAHYVFPDAMQARWIRFIADKNCVATATLEYK